MKLRRLTTFFLKFEVKKPGPLAAFVFEIGSKKR